MWPFRKKEPKAAITQPMPGWLKLLLVAFIGYVFIMSSVPSPEDKPNAIKQAVDKAKLDLQQQDMLNITGFGAKIFPDNLQGLRIEENEEGSGKPAVCGQKVSIAYQAYLAQGNEIEDRASIEKPLRFAIGAGKTLPVFEQSAVGMKPGGKRSVLAPLSLSYGILEFKRDDVPLGGNIRFAIEMISAEPELPTLGNTAYRIADLIVGEGADVICGASSAFRILAWNGKGKVVFSNISEKEPFTISPGASTLMLGLEQGVIGMRIGGTRLLVISPEFQKTMHGAPSKSGFPSASDEVLLVEITAIP